jgi:methionyl aminopeptidase
VEQVNKTKERISKARMVFENFREAGKILKETLAYAKKITKKGILLLEIAESIEEFVKNKNARLAFPPNLSINEIAAHYSPFSQDKTLAHGLIKIDLGISYKNCIVDAAITLDLENHSQNKKMIKANMEALKKGIEAVKPGVEVREIGKTIEAVAVKSGFKPIFNLMGHNITPSHLHGGKNIPNYDNKDKTRIEENEIVAIEPFFTLEKASGYVEDGRPSAIWRLISERRPRLHREIFNYIKENYGTFPFSQRWLEKKFSNVAVTLKIFQGQGIVHNYRELVESTRAKVSQAETTVLVGEKPIVIDIFDLFD